MSRICNAIRPWDNPIEIFAVEIHQELKGNGETWIVPPAPRDLVLENGVPGRRSVASPHGPGLSSFSGFITHHASRSGSLSLNFRRLRRRVPEIEPPALRNFLREKAATRSVRFVHVVFARIY